MANNQLTDKRARLRKAAQDYQSTLSWYQENLDSPNAEQDCDEATAAFKREIGYRETDIIADLLDEIDELQEYRKAEANNKPVAWTCAEQLRDAKAQGCGYIFGLGIPAKAGHQIMLYANTTQVTSELFISGVRDEDGDCTAVDDAAAQFWTVYRRNEDGTCDALMDFMSRESAETAIQMIAKKPVQTGVDDDVRNIIGLLETNEWAEHCTETVLGSRLEAEITRLVGRMQPAPVVPDECPGELLNQIVDMCDGFEVGDNLAQEIWNACRAAMLKGGAA